MGKLKTASKTAKRHGHRPTQIYYQMYRRPPNEVLEYLYAGGPRASIPKLAAVGQHTGWPPLRMAFPPNFKRAA